MDEQLQGHVFISYVREDKDRSDTHMNEELNLAIKQLRKRPRDQAWFLPVVLTGEVKDVVPDWEIMPGKTLQSLHCTPLSANWDDGVKQIISVIKSVPAKIQSLIVALKNKDGGVRQSAAIALGAIGPDAVPSLIKALKDEEYRIRKSAAEALGRIGLDAVPSLIEALKDEEYGVRSYASLALGRIGLDARAAVPSLIEALKDEYDSVRRYAADALERIQGETETE